MLERNQMNSLTDEGQALLTSLSEEADFLMVRKGHAYALLQSRGHVIIPSIRQLPSQ